MNGIPNSNPNVGFGGPNPHSHSSPASLQSNPTTMDPNRIQSSSSSPPVFQQQQHLLPNQVHFNNVDALPRNQILDFVKNIITRAVTVNEDLIEAGISFASGSPREPFMNNDNNINFDVDIVFQTLNKRDFTVKNLTLIMALVYMDRIANILKVFASKDTIRKMFASCLIVASKMHNNEISREALAYAFELDVQELLEAENYMVESVKDLAIHPQELLSYMRSLIGTRGVEIQSQSHVQPQVQHSQPSFSKQPQPQQQQQQQPYHHPASSLPSHSSL